MKIQIAVEYLSSGQDDSSHANPDLWQYVLCVPVIKPELEKYTMSRTVSLIRAMRRKYAGVTGGMNLMNPTNITPPHTQQMAHAPHVVNPTGVLNSTQGALSAPRQAGPHVMGTGIPQTGLPPSKVNAAPLPGAPGGVASNPIERNGGLGPAGTVDGNHAAGIRKGFKIG